MLRRALQVLTPPFAPAKVARTTVAAEAQDAALSDNILHLVFSFVGCDQYMYVCVNRRWRDAYGAVCREAAAIAASNEQTKMEGWYLVLEDRGEACFWEVERVRKTLAATSYASAFASLSRLQMACAIDLQLSTNTELPKAAGRWAEEQTLLWAKQNGLPWVSAVCEGAALEGRVDMLWWLHTQQGCPCDVGPVLKAALHSCNVDLLRWMHNKFSYDGLRRHVTDEMIIESECLRSVEVLAWLQLPNFFTDDDMYRNFLRYIEVAAARGWCDSVKYLYSLQRHRWHGDAGDSSIIKHAVRSGNVEMVRHLIAAGCALPTNTANSSLLQDAVCSGSVSMLNYVIDEELDQWGSTERTNALLDMAGLQGHLETVQWLKVERKAEWPLSLWKHVAWHNGEHYTHCWPSNTLAYAIEHGCAWGVWPQSVCCDLALGQRPAVDWAHANGCPCGADCPMRKQ